MRTKRNVWCGLGAWLLLAASGSCSSGNSTLKNDRDTAAAPHEDGAPPAVGQADGARTGDSDSSSGSTVDATIPCEVPGMPGVRVCCGRPGEMPGNNCLLWDAVQASMNNCVPQGALFDGRQVGLGRRCCVGLKALDPLMTVDGGGEPGLPEGCGYDPGPPGTKICVNCGDGICSRAENRCICPADCSR